jgi:hypothetical protein
MSNEEADDVDLAPRNRRKHDQRKGVMGAAVRATEKPEAVSVARLAMIVSPILLSIILGLVGAMYADFKDQQKDTAAQLKEFGDGLQQVLINQAVGIAERDDQKRRLTKIEEGMTRLWQQVIGRGKEN